jgi:hypothetical protein
MKIVATANFDEDTYSERVIATDVSENWAKMISECMNQLVGPHSRDFFVPKPDDYELYIWEP